MPADQTTSAHVYEIELLEHNAVIACSCGFWTTVPRQFAEVALKDFHQEGHPPAMRTA